MDKNQTVNIKATPFPDQAASDIDKASIEYGLSVGKAIEGEWFNRTSGNGCRYYDQYGEFHRLRLYARGEQPISQYKNILAIDGDLSYLNLDWSIVKIIPKFVDIVVNGMNDRLYKVRAESQDIMSAEKKNLFQDMIEADMVAKDLLELTKEQFGIDAYNVDPNDIPETEEELSLYMQLKYKPSIEIAEEIAINVMLEMNDFQDCIASELYYDLTTIGIGALKHSFSAGSGVNVEIVDPATTVYSYTEKRDFSDCFYFGEVKQVHYTELLKIDPTLTKDKLAEIKKAGAGWFRHFPIISTFQDSIYNEEVVTLLYFNYKTTKNFVYKKKNLASGGSRVTKKDDNFRPNPEDADKFERVDIPKDVWYDGVLVLGSNIMIKWELLKNMIRPESASQKALPNYVLNAPRMYRGKIESTVGRMIPFANQIQLTHLKLQQVKSRITPDGVFIDADGINEVDLGTGAAYNPEDALKMYFQTGSVIGRSYTGDGEFNNARVPISELNSNSGQSKMAALVSDYNHNLNMIRDCTGLNEARDASTPNADSLVGLQKLAALNSNVATNHILYGGLNIIKRLSQGLSLRVADILEFADFKEEFAMQIGKYNLAILEDVKKLYLHSFGIFIELSPDEEERSQTEANIQMALSRDQINLEDAIDIRSIGNIKLANELLKVKTRKKEEQVQKNKQAEMQMQSQLNMQSQQAAAEAKTQQMQMEAQAKSQIKQSEIEGEIKKMEREAELKMVLMEKEFNYQMQLKGIDVQSLQDRENKKEEAKDKRINIQATKQSKMIDQRKNNLPPIDFESSDDSLDGFDFSSFGPK
jgi:hypothetical protein